MPGSFFSFRKDIKVAVHAIFFCFQKVYGVIFYLKKNENRIEEERFPGIREVFRRGKRSFLRDTGACFQGYKIVFSKIYV